MNTRYTVQFAIGDLDDVRDIYTEADVLLECYTLTTSDGVWKGTLERSYKLEYIGTQDEADKLVTLSERLKSRFNQDAVLLTQEKVNAVLI